MLRPFAPAFFALILCTPLAAQAADARIVEQKAQWELAYGLVYHRVFGEVENTSSSPLPFVRLTVQWIGPSGGVVHEMTAYNQRAEALATIEDPGELEKKLQTIPPLAPGEKDLFRVGIAKDELPAGKRFTTAFAKIVEPEAEEAAGAPPASTDEGGGEGALDLNAATKEDLLGLPEMNEARAVSILNYREANGAFIQLEELELIPQVLPVYETLRKSVRL